MEGSNDSNRFMQFLRWPFSKREDQVSSSSWTPFPAISTSAFKPVAAIVLCFSLLFIFTSSFGSFFHAQPYGGLGSSILQTIIGAGSFGFNSSSSDDDIRRREQGLVPLPPFKCPPPENLTCPTPPTPSISNNSNNKSSPVCPEYFRWIHEDLRPWKETGITREMVDKPAGKVHFRIVVVNGRAYFNKYDNAFQTRDVFTKWGILQLLRRYPGRVPDFDMVFSCEDPPNVGASNYRKGSPPAQFAYSGDDGSLDIVFPDWSFWGWAEVNIKPWKQLLKEMGEGNKETKWVDRKPYAYWKGNPYVSGSRLDLLKCNVSKQHDWKARLFQQDWVSETKNGFKNSNLASQCKYRYKIYIEGRSWSVSQKYILACNSPTLRINPRFHDFFTRSLVPLKHYWPIHVSDKCNSIKFAVDWGNHHQKEARAIGRGGSEFIRRNLTMDYVYDYMFHLLNEYSKLLKYKPTVPPNAVEFCSETMACKAEGLVRTYMMDSMVDSIQSYGPCSLPPPYTPQEKKAIDDRNDKAESIGKAESEFMLENVKMDYDVYDYILFRVRRLDPDPAKPSSSTSRQRRPRDIISKQFHVPNEYSKLQKFKPKVPPGRCEQGGTLDAMMESMVNSSRQPMMESMVNSSRQPGGDGRSTWEEREGDGARKQVGNRRVGVVGKFIITTFSLDSDVGSRCFFPCNGHCWVTLPQTTVRSLNK